MTVARLPSAYRLVSTMVGTTRQSSVGEETTQNVNVSFWSKGALVRFGRTPSAEQTDYHRYEVPPHDGLARRQNSS